MILGFIVSDGWCVDANGAEAGRNLNQVGYTDHGCFAQCENDSNIKGCTYYMASNTCITYTRSIVAGNQNAGYKCYHRGKNHVWLKTSQKSTNY